MSQDNLTRLLQLICVEGPITRTELARRAGVTRVTVGSLVGDLVRAGLVQELAAAPSTEPGRPASRVVPHPLGPVGIGLQVEVDHIAGCVVDLAGRLRRRELRQVDVRRLPPADAARAARPVLRKLFDHATTSGQLVTGVAVSIGALFARDRAERIVVRSVPGLGWSHTDLRALVGKQLEAIGVHGIDVHLGGVAMYAAHADLPAANALYIGGEGEIEAVQVVDGRPHRGSAGSLGHVPIRRGRSSPCRCGERGCLDTYAGRTAMADAAGVAEVALPRLLGDPDPFTRRVHDGDRDAVRVTTAAGRALAEALLGPLAVLDSAELVVGGRLAALGEPLRTPLRDRLADAHTSPRLRASSTGPQAVLRGAGSAALAGVFADPLGWSP